MSLQRLTVVLQRFSLHTNTDHHIYITLTVSKNAVIRRRFPFSLINSK